MPSKLNVVAILTANKALSAILHMVLSERRDLRVREFASEAELSLYMHLAPVDLLICDVDPEADGGMDLVLRLRGKSGLVSPDFQVIALTRQVTLSMKAECVAAGIDEVVVKPMSPKYLEDRVIARLREGARHIAYRGPERRNRPAARSRPSARFDRPASNVIPLFGRGVQPSH